MNLFDGTIHAFMGMDIVVSPFCFEVVMTNDRLFPASRHRSKRIHKKLVKRYGGEFKVVNKPAIWQMRDKIVVHPTLFEELKKKCK